ncbi:MAG TPA: GNVR domain-containing protein [Polyangiaceae bacterium]|nr:GNVR domain-containing protein [Polyangiaceae bacterium]
MTITAPGNERAKHASSAPLLREVWSGPAPEPAPRDALSGAELWRLVRRHYGMVLAVGVVTLGVVLAFTLFSRMEFRASGRLYLGELEGPKRAGPSESERLDFSGETQGDVWSEVEIMTSSELVKRAILTSGANVEVEVSGRPAPRYLAWRLARRDPRLLDAGLRELRARDSELGEAARRGATFRVHFVNPSEYEVFAGGSRRGRGRLGEALDIDGTKLTLVAGTERGPVAGRDYEVRVSPLEDVYAAVQKSLTVTVPKAGSTAEPVKVVTLAVSGNSPRATAEFLTTLMHSYLAERHAWKTEEATASEDFVTHQLESVRAELDEIQAKLAAYRSNHRAVVLDNEAKALIEQMGKYEEQRVNSRLEVAALTHVKNALKGSTPPPGAFLLGESDDTVLAGLADSLSQARQKLTDLDARYNAAAPEVRAQRAQVDAQLDAIRNYVGSRLKRAEQMQGEIGGIIDQFESRLKGVPSAEIGLAQLTRESEVYSRLYSYLLERQQQTAIVKASTVSKNRVLDAPEPPLREDAPKLALRLASGPVGLLIGLLVLVGRAMLSDTFQDEAELERALGSVPIWGRVPRKRRHRRGALAPACSFELPFEPPEPDFDEAFRALRTNLLYAQPDEAAGVVLVTSPEAADGKTTVALSLAALLVAGGRRTLVIDVDLRRPSYCVGHDEPSLEGYLLGECSWRDAVHRIATSHGDFDALGAAGPTAPERLGSTAFANLLAEARSAYDAIVLDAASFPAFSDAAVLARSADCVLSVVSLGRTRRGLAVEHVRSLAVQARRLAVVANGAHPERTVRPRATLSQLPVSASVPMTIPLRRVGRGTRLALAALGLAVASLAAFHALGAVNGDGLAERLAHEPAR